MQPNPYARYRESAVLSASPVQLVVMLYDGAIRACGAARAAMAARRPAAAHASLVQAQAIVAELRSTLDLSQGELAQRLESLYAFMAEQLVQANVRKDADLTATVQGLLEELRTAWAQLARVERS